MIQKYTPNSNIYAVKNAHTAVRNTFATVNSSTGRVESGGTGNTQFPVGMIKSEADGSGTLLGDSSGTVRAVAEAGFCIQYAVTGASAATDIGAPVYIATSTTLTTSQPSGSFPCGIIVQHVSGTTCIVYLFTVPEMFIYKLTL